MIGMRTRVENDGITAESVMTDPPANAWDAEESQRDRANATYEQVKAQTEQLRAFLGEQYDAYLYETEGL